MMDDHIVVVQKRNVLWQKTGNSHVDRDIAISFETRCDDALLRFDTDFALVGETLLMHKTHETAGAIAALLHLAAIGIEDSIAEIDVRLRRLFNQKNLVATHAKMAISQITQLLRRERYVLTNSIQNNEIVAQTMHFREFELHKPLRFEV